MKLNLKAIALALGLVLGSSLQNKTSAQYYDNRNEVTYQTFYDDLSPYGQWVDYPGYGYVWVPDAGPDFRPYSSNGHWVWTDEYEWMWVSDYDWGWGPFHYGRWEEDSRYGWFWVPGYEWSPAWVAWRDGGDYYGWAPLRPGITISINFNIGSYSPPYGYWNFAPRRFITSSRIFDFCVDRRQNITIINYTTIIVNNNYRNNSYYGFRSGPSRYDAERYCGRINPVRFRDSYTPGRSQFRNNEVSFYRPQVKHDDENRYAPRHFERYDNRVADRPDRNNNGFRRNDNVNNDDNNKRFRDRSDRNEQEDRSNDRRVFRPTDRLDRNSNTGNDNNVRRFDRTNDNNDTRNPHTGNDNNFRRFDRTNNNNENRNTTFRREDVRNNDQPQRFPQQIERRQDQQQPRQFDRREDNNGNRNSTFRREDMRNNDQPQRFPQQMERRQEQRQQPMQQMERRQEQPSRSFERRDDAGRQPNSGERNNGNSRRRF